MFRLVGGAWVSAISVIKDIAVVFMAAAIGVTTMTVTVTFTVVRVADIHAEGKTQADMFLMKVVRIPVGLFVFAIDGFGDNCQEIHHVVSMAFSITGSTVND